MNVEVKVNSRMRTQREKGLKINVKEMLSSHYAEMLLIELCQNGFSIRAGKLLDDLKKSTTHN